MPVDFTGQTQWRDTITGPANADEVTGPSVSDMGVLLADRTLWQKEGTIGYYDQRTIGISVSSTTQDSPIFTSRFALAVDTSRVLVVQSLPLSFVEDGPVTITPLLFDDADLVIGTASALALEADVRLQQLLIVAGYDSVGSVSCSFGVRVAAPGLAKFTMPTGAVRTIAMAYPIP